MHGLRLQSRLGGAASCCAVPTAACDALLLCAAWQFYKAYDRILSHYMGREGIRMDLTLVGILCMCD